MRPTQDYVLIKPHEETVSKGGIVIPDTAQKKATMATVVAVGPGTHSALGFFREMLVKAGEVVIYPRHSRTTDVFVDDVKHFLIREGDLLAVVPAGTRVQVHA